MSEPALLQPSLAGIPVPSPSEGAGLPCERCGTFIQGAPEQVGTRKVCKACALLLLKDLRLYPTWYVYVLGIVLNFTLAGILSAINWKRLGDRTRMRNSLLVTAFGVVLTAVMATFEFRPGGGIILNIIGTRVAAQALGSAYDKHKRAGGARAHLLWPVVILAGVLTLLVAAATVYFLLTHQTPPE